MFLEEIRTQMTGGRGWAGRQREPCEAMERIQSSTNQEEMNETNPVNTLILEI